MKDTENILDESGEDAPKAFNDGPLIQTKNMQYYDLFKSNSAPLPKNNSSIDELSTLNYDAFATNSSSLNNGQSKQLKGSVLDDFDDLFESNSHRTQRTDSKNDLLELFDSYDKQKEQKQTNSNENLIDIFDYSNKQQTKNKSKNNFDELDENSISSSSDTLVCDELFDRINKKA